MAESRSVEQVRPGRSPWLLALGGALASLCLGLCILVAFQFTQRYRSDLLWWLGSLGLVGALFGYLIGHYREQSRRREAEVSATTAQLDYLIRGLEGRVARRTVALRRRTVALKAANAVAKRAHVEALAASEAKSHFIANVSHEVRTPLNGILGMSELLLREQLAPRIYDQLMVLHQSAKDLLTVLNDILDFSKIEAGKLSLERIDFKLRDLLFGVARIYDPGARARGNELVCDVQEDLPDRYYGDPTRLRQVVTNLVSNAIKFTEGGQVLLRARVAARDEEFAEVELAVEDTGIGIAADQLGAIFESFSQADGTTTRRYGGTGLGLAISSRLAALMGGELKVASELGQGSTFSMRLRLPLCRTPSALERAVPERGLNGLGALVVDEHLTTRQLVAARCRRWGMVTHDYAVPGEALAALELLGAELAVAIVDCSGAEARLQRFCLQLKHLRNVPVITMGGVGAKGQEAEEGVPSAAAPSAAAHLLKPVRSSELLSAILRVLGKEAAGNARSPEPGVEGLSQPLALRVLVAEDNKVNLMVVERLLRSRGCQVVSATNGEQVLAAFERAAQEGAGFDVVLMDIQMPKMDGYEAARRIRRFESEQNSAPTPIVALTAHAMVGERERCLAAGMDDHLTKPLQVALLNQLLERIAAEAVRTTHSTPRPGAP